MKAILFKNFTDESFTWKCDGIAYTFEPGQEIYLEDYKAEHFAKHLVDRELDKKTMRTDYLPEREILEKQCFPSSETLTPLEALNVNEKKKVVKTKKVEPEFEELKESKKK